jgi:hypothetical protein
MAAPKIGAGGADDGAADAGVAQGPGRVQLADARGQPLERIRCALAVGDLPQLGAVSVMVEDPVRGLTGHFRQLHRSSFSPSDRRP